ncbi:MAG: hypothetical protein COU29_00760 [Candidatus Magasanikbacteria bacterium CG10_big_fil_rev_8_21_14_0_10_36_32]|uniref:DDH domain-containing protein n=1 Tax=Candidatus Magasanikbacteria bacterium CG10_big_fil_rev_8_21_14_0_10_36_32 TaxID=1974646 RepID=A0A2M6W687_9BACT|nr:MAG: hypothetical protein COU29_00760 [Candidatus Magasanikbacteria bacterium CG10_big_fil_rev_8_21_14_0_10_36_32]
MFTTTQQLQKLLETSRHILVVFGAEKNPDAIAGALALKKFFDKQHKQIDLVSTNFKQPSAMSFLPGLEQIKSELTHLQKFIIKVDISKSKIETISYDVKDDWLSINLTPKHGFITKNELRTAQSTYKYDLIITLSAQDLESLGDIFLNNTDLFYRVPIVNIDHRPSNEHFGQINLVDISATSSSEIIFKTLEQLNAAHIDEEIATALLTGMISQTRSFKTPNVNPDTLNLAGRLMNLGADREKIIRHLYYTKSLATLKLWGQALSNLQNDRETGLAWTTVTREDFARSGASEDDLRELIHDLISNSPEIKMILIIFENSNDKKINCLLATEKYFDAMELSKTFNPSGDKKIAVFSISDKNLKEAEETAVTEIRNKAKFLLSGLN